MCGIFGIISSNYSGQDFKKATDTLYHRGPDDYGSFQNENVYLGHRRLSIIDLDGGHQPIFNEDRSKCIIFNGEIYNFPELRETLIKRGHKFATKSDTETILHAYEEYDECCVEYLRGMFAFAIWDLKEKKLFIARDRLGIKPLFWGEYNGGFYFASEMKAILADLNFPRKIDNDALASYFTLSYIPAPLSIYSNIQKLLPGHTLTWKNGKIKIKKFWDLYINPDKSKTEKYFIDEFMNLLEESVKLRLISDVPLGAFLSGGIDSSTIVALMSKVSNSPVNTFCMGFGGNVGGYLDERKYATKISELYETNHKEYEVLPQFGGLIQKIVKSFDEPFADESTIPSYYVSQIARQNVKVALSGLGGDELFAGYERYLGFQLSRIYDRFPNFIKEKIFRNAIENLNERTDGHYTINHMKRFVRSASKQPDRRYLGYISRMNEGIKKDFFSDSAGYNHNFNAVEDIILSYFNSENISDKSDSLNRAFFTDIKVYLPDDILTVTDRLSMHHSLEVRVPFIDHKFVEFVANIPPELKIKWFKKKILLKKATKNLLPKEILNHRKQGFVGPTTYWLKNELKPEVLNILSKKNLDKHDLFNSKIIQRVLDEHFSGKEIHDTLIWSLINFQSWYEMYIEKNEI